MQQFAGTDSIPTVTPILLHRIYPPARSLTSYVESRWVSENPPQRRRFSKLPVVSREPSKNEAGDKIGVYQSDAPETPDQAVGERTMGEKGGKKKAYGMGASSTVSSSFFGVDATIANTSPATGRAGVSSSDVFFSGEEGEDGGGGGGAMDTFSFSASSVDDDARRRELRRSSGRWRKNVIGYPDLAGGGSGSVGVRERFGTGRDGWDVELSSMATGSDDESSRRSLKYDEESRRNSGDDDDRSSRSSSSWNSSWNSSRWGGSAFGSNNGGGDDRFPSRFNVVPSESRLRIHSAIAGTEVMKHEGEDSKSGRSAGQSGAEVGGVGAAFARGIRGPTPPKRRRRTPAGAVASQRLDASSSSSYMITPAQAAAAEADRLNNVMQERRPLRVQQQQQPEKNPAVMGQAVGGAINATVKTVTSSASTEPSFPPISTRRASFDSSNIVDKRRHGGDNDLGGPQPTVADEGSGAEAEAKADAGVGEVDGSRRGESMSPPPTPSSPSSSALMTAPRVLESRADVEMGADSIKKGDNLVRERGDEAAAAAASAGSAEAPVTRKRRSKVDWPGSLRPEVSLTLSLAGGGCSFCPISRVLLPFVSLPIMSFCTMCYIENHLTSNLAWD